MLTEVAIKKLIKSHGNPGDKKVREAYGVMSSRAGLNGIITEDRDYTPED